MGTCKVAWCPTTSKRDPDGWFECREEYCLNRGYICKKCHHDNKCVTCITSHIDNNEFCKSMQMRNNRRWSLQRIGRWNLARRRELMKGPCEKFKKRFRVGCEIYFERDGELSR